jgi:hypothetical protein
MVVDAGAQLSHTTTFPYDSAGNLLTAERSQHKRPFSDAVLPRHSPHGGPVVAEACESDGTRVGYRPSSG